MTSTIPSLGSVNAATAAVDQMATSAKQMATSTGAGPVTLEKALELRDTFSSTFGTMLFGQMMKAMRSTVGEPAYFHGGQAEEMFRGQLDQLLSEKMADASGERFVKPMFERAYPEQAAVINQESNQQSTQPTSRLDNLTQLTRR